MTQNQNSGNIQCMKQTDNFSFDFPQGQPRPSNKEIGDILREALEDAGKNPDKAADKMMSKLPKGTKIVRSGASGQLSPQDLLGAESFRAVGNECTSSLNSGVDAPWGKMDIRMKVPDHSSPKNEDEFGVDELTPLNEFNFWWDNRICYREKLGSKKHINSYYNHVCTSADNPWWDVPEMPDWDEASNLLPSVFDKVPQTPFAIISQNQYAQMGWKYIIPKEVDDWLRDKQIEKQEELESPEDDTSKDFNFRPISEIFKYTKSKSILIDRTSVDDPPILINYFDTEIARKLVKGGRSSVVDKDGIPVDFFKRVKQLAGTNGYYPLDYILTISCPVSFEPKSGKGSVIYSTQCFVITCDQMLKDLSYLQVECNKESISDDMNLNIGCVLGYEESAGHLHARQWAMPWTMSGIARTIMNSLNYVHYSTLREVRESSTISSIAQVKSSEDLIGLGTRKVVRPEVNVSILPAITYLNKPKVVRSDNKTGREVSGHERAGHWRTNWRTGKKDIWIEAHKVKGGTPEGQRKVAKLVTRKGKLVEPNK